MRRLFAFCFAGLLLSVTVAGADVSMIRNGSFEMDGQILDITMKPPMNWQYVDIPFQFDGFVGHQWATNGDWSLTLSTDIYATFQPGDSATVEQCVFINGDEHIACDLELTTELPQNYVWDSNLFSAILTVDGNAVWDSNSFGLSGNGVYHIEVNDLNVTPGSHLLGVGIRANTAAPTPYYYSYYARWDSIRFVSSYGGDTYPPADFTQDCVVDINDLKVFADGWLDPNGPDLTGDMAVDFADFAVFGDYWMLDCADIPVEPNFIDPPEADFNNDGVIDFADLLVLCEDWLGGCSVCVRSDLHDDGFVDFADFAWFAEYWQQD